MNENIGKNEENGHEDTVRLLSHFSAYFASKMDRNKMIIYKEVMKRKAKIDVLELGE